MVLRVHDFTIQLTSHFPCMCPRSGQRRLSRRRGVGKVDFKFKGRLRDFRHALRPGRVGHSSSEVRRTSAPPQPLSPTPLLLRATSMQPASLILRPQLTVPGRDSCVLLCRTAPSTPWMATGERAALRRAAAAWWQLRSDSSLFALWLERREGGRSKGRQGALCARLAQEAPRGGR